MKSCLGFIGAGAITEAMVTGLVHAMPDALKIIVSARNHEVAKRLAANHHQVVIESSNQAIIEQADIVVLAIRPQVAESVIRPLLFRDGQKIISVIAATPISLLQRWIDVDVAITQAIPLPFVAHCQGVTAIYPPDEEVVSLFDKLGRAVECDRKEDYDLLAAASALMSTYYGVLDSAKRWLCAQGLQGSKAENYLSHLFASLSQPLTSNASQSFEALSVSFATPGGLNEQVLHDFIKQGGDRALHQALDNVLERITQK